MKTTVWTGQNLVVVITIKDEDGLLVDLTGHTATVVFNHPSGSVTKTGSVDDVASTVTASLVAADLTTVRVGKWQYQPVIASGGLDWPGSIAHFHLFERLS